MALIEFYGDDAGRGVVVYAIARSLAGLRQRAAAFEAWLVSPGFRKIDTVVLGVLPNHNEVEEGQATIFVGEGANFIGFVTKLSKKRSMALVERFTESEFQEKDAGRC